MSEPQNLYTNSFVAQRDAGKAVLLISLELEEVMNLKR